MAGDKLHITLNVYNRRIPVNILREDEEYYRNAAETITRTINKYADAFNGKKTESELLYMSLIDIALHYEKMSKRNDTAPYSDILDKLTQEIQEIL